MGFSDEHRRTYSATEPRETYIHRYLDRVFSRYKKGDLETLKQAGLATQRDNIIGLLTEILEKDDPATLSRIASQSFDHGIGYKKLILDENKEQGWRLRVNVYWPREGGMDIESWHTHRWPFVSSMVAGGGFDNWNYTLRNITPEEQAAVTKVEQRAKELGWDNDKTISVWKRIEACHMLDLDAHELKNEAVLLAMGGKEKVERYANRTKLLDELGVTEAELKLLYPIRFQYEVPTRQQTLDHMAPKFKKVVALEMKGIHHIREGDQYVQPIEETHRLVFYPTNPMQHPSAGNDDLTKSVDVSNINPSAITPTISTIVTAPPEGPETDYLFRSPISEADGFERPSYTTDQLKNVLKNFLTLLEVQKHREGYFVGLYNRLKQGEPGPGEDAPVYREKILPILERLAGQFDGASSGELQLESSGLYDRFVLPAYVAIRKELGGANSPEFQTFKDGITSYVKEHIDQEHAAIVQGSYHYPETKTVQHIMTYGREGTGYRGAGGS